MLFLVHGINVSIFLFNSLKGLLDDDLMKTNPITTEALKRLPSLVYQERQFRLARSISVSGNRSILPESEWLKPEQV